MKQQNYQVSVITPFHNVDMDMFRRGYESLQCQSIGFDNIQWIVVLHNTKPELREEVEKLLAGQENIIVKTLDNDIHSPSNPRNYGLKLATAPYVGFWDGDDSFTPNCFQTTVSKMKQHNSQMVVFRREYELELNYLFLIVEVKKKTYSKHLKWYYLKKGAVKKVNTSSKEQKRSNRQKPYKLRTFRD